jgi:sugar phosphate isomerase/epimerase
MLFSRRPGSSRRIVVVRIAVRELALQVPASERLTRARECGADGIELCFGPYEFDNHPFLQLDGAAVLQQRSQALGIELTSAYAGHLHDASLADADVVRRQRQISALARLIDASGRAGVRVVVVPLFRSAPRVESDALAKLRSILVPLAEQAKAQGVTLAVEAAWPVNALQSFLGASCALHVAYDVGNAFRLGYDPLTDLSLLGDQVIQVRLRDNTVSLPSSTVCSTGSILAGSSSNPPSMRMLSHSSRPFSLSGSWIPEREPLHDCFLPPILPPLPALRREALQLCLPSAA